MKKRNMESRLLSEFKKGSKWYMVDGGQFDEFSPRIVNVVIGDTVEEDCSKTYTQASSTR